MPIKLFHYLKVSYKAEYCLRRTKNEISKHDITDYSKFLQGLSKPVTVHELEFTESGNEFSIIGECTPMEVTEVNRNYRGYFEIDANDSLNWHHNYLKDIDIVVLMTEHRIKEHLKSSWSVEPYWVEFNVTKDF